jgi:predicted DNA-binding transcriptional regulator YafY
MMTPIQRYELIRPILSGEKSVSQVASETEIPIRTLYRYVKRFRESGGQLESLADKSRAPHTRAKMFRETDKDLIINYKLNHPQKSVRTIASELTESGTLSINYHSVADIIRQRGVSHPPFLINRKNS